MDTQPASDDARTGATTDRSGKLDLLTEIVWWTAIIGLIFLSQARLDWFYFLFRDTFLSRFFDPSVLASNAVALSTVITPVRGIIFIYSTSILAYPLLSDIWRKPAGTDRTGMGRVVLQTVMAFAVLCLLFFPGRIDGLAQEYANSSLVFFTKAATLNFHQRFLMPILANVLFFRGDFFFLIFSFLCALVLVLLVRIWFQRNEVPVSLLEFISLGTASFIYFQITAPGYPDVLVNIFIILAFTYSLGTRAKLALFAFSLVSHEASLIIWLGLCWLLFDRKEFTRFLAITAIYVLFWLIQADGIAGILGSRQSDGISNFQWAWERPLPELLGILFAFKALWALVITALWVLVSQKRHREAMQVGLLLVAGLIMTFLGVDTSRLFGWAFMAIMISWKVLASAAEGRWSRFIQRVAALNLLIPPVYIQLNFLSSVRPGLYAVILDRLSSLFTR